MYSNVPHPWQGVGVAATCNPRTDQYEAITPVNIALYGAATIIRIVTHRRFSTPCDGVMTK